MIFVSGESELFEFNSQDDSLCWIESERAREHDSQLTGCDYSVKLGLIVTADVNGVIRVWTKNKKFVREINFPDKIDSITFLNSEGDLLVSHAQRISKIKMTEYWTKTFDYYGITKSSEEPTLYKTAKEKASLFDDQDYVMPPEIVTRVVVRD